MTSFSIGPFKGKVFLSDCDTATLVISHVWAPFRSLAEISMDTPFCGVTEKDIERNMIWWFGAGERNLLDDLSAAGYVSSEDSNEPVDEDEPDEYTEVI